MDKMVLVKILGILDLTSMAALLIASFFIPPPLILYMVSAYLITKGAIFTLISGDIASIIDILCGLYCLAVILGYRSDIISGFAVAYLAQKAFFSLK